MQIYNFRIQERLNKILSKKWIQHNSRKGNVNDLPTYEVVRLIRLVVNLFAELDGCAVD